MDPSQTYALLLEAGFTSESTESAVAAEDLHLLVHSGRHQVWLSVPDDGEGGP